MMKVFNYLDELFPNPICELNYSNDIEFLIAVVLSAQTTDKKVNKITEVLFKYSIEELSIMDIKSIEDILKPLGMARKKAIYIKNIAFDVLNKYNGVVPKKQEELMKLSGVGRKTANLILSSIYNEPLIAVDTHIMRVTKRLDIALINDNPIEVEKKLYKYIPKDRLLRTHQQLVLFGRYKCKAIKPECKNCKLIDICKYEKKAI